MNVFGLISQLISIETLRLTHNTKLESLWRRKSMRRLRMVEVESQSSKQKNSRNMLVVKI